MKKTLLFSLTPFILIIISSFIFCRGISAGKDISEIDNKIEKLRDENLVLELKISEKEACGKIYSEALVLDFKSIADIPISKTNKVALNR